MWRASKLCCGRRVGRVRAIMALQAILTLLRKRSSPLIERCSSQDLLDLILQVRKEGKSHFLMAVS